MIKKIKDNKIRFSYSIFFLVSLISAWLFRDYFVGASTRLNLISYMGTIITMLGMVITFSEVIHSVMINRSIQRQAQEVLSGFKVREFDFIISELLVVLEYIISDIDNKQFAMALRQIYSFNRTFKRVSASYLDYYGESEKHILAKLKSVEMLVSSFKVAGNSITYPAKKINSINDDLIDIKHTLVRKNSSLGGSENVAS